MLERPGRNTLKGKSEVPLCWATLKATKENEAASGGGRYEGATVCEVVTTGVRAGPRKSEGVSLRIWGRVRTTGSRVRKLGLREVQKLTESLWVQGRAGVGPGSRALEPAPLAP